MLKRTNCHGYRGSPQREPHGRREGPRDALNEACQADSSPHLERHTAAPADPSTVLDESWSLPPRVFKVVAVSALPDAPQGLDELLQFFTTAAQAKT